MSLEPVGDELLQVKSITKVEKIIFTGKCCRFLYLNGYRYVSLAFKLRSCEGKNIRPKPIIYVN